MILWVVFCGSMLLAIAGVYAARALALRSNWLDHPNARSFHTAPVPRSGGIGLLFPVFVVGIWVALSGSPHGTWSLSWSLAFLIGVLSYIDDRSDLSRSFRFAFHGIVAIFVLWLTGPGWAGKALPLVGYWLPEPLVGVLLFVWIAGLINAVNFMDGIDGIAAIFGICAAFGYATLVFAGEVNSALAPNSQTTGLILLALIASLIAFLCFNWSPASIFLGDSGSTFLGAFFAIMPLALAFDGLPLARALEAGFLFTWPFVVDTSFTFVKRALQREPVFDAHRTHLYQVLAATFPTRQSGHRMVSILYGLLLLVGIGLFWTSGAIWAKLAVCGWLWLALVAWTYGIRLPKLREKEAREAELTRDKLPMTPDFMGFEIYLNPPDVGQVEREKVREAFDSGFIAPLGPQLDAFEEALASYIGVAKVHAVNSGTSAIHLGLRALGVGPGDCVICPDFTFVAAVNPVRYLGAEPVLVDVSLETWGMDPQRLEEAIESLTRQGKRIRAIVVVHAYGIPAPVHELLPIAERHGIALFEDCAGAIGTYINGIHVGNFGAAAAFSFNGNKLLTTSGGGALIFRDPGLYEYSRSWANQGKPGRTIGYVHTSVGYNYKLSNISAAIGLGQLITLEQRMQKKAFIRENYERTLAVFDDVGLMPDPPYGKRNNWLNCVRLPEAQDVMEAVITFRRNGIEAAPMWTPQHKMNFNADVQIFGGENSREIFERFVCLPSGTQLRKGDIERISALFAKLPKMKY